MDNYFNRKIPEEVGISSAWIINFLNRLENQNLPLHSFILMKDDSIVSETYYAPYKADTLHRMFSITKSFVSVAIGLLEEEGKLALDDAIISYFPEKLPDTPISPYIKNMTIRDMLKMSSCHSKTTYKQPGCTDWIGSFFTATPSHAPGTVFSYDTSATHTMCALVEKLAGNNLLDYLREKFLDEIGFSKDAYILKAPQGETLAGSGLMATPMDILKFMYLISKGGEFNNKQLLPREYIKAATCHQIDTYAKSSTWEEMQGYGYQFWITTHNGVACYGMGGQYAIYYPDQNIILITTADTQGRAGRTQLIYDAFYQEIYDKLESADTSSKINPAYKTATDVSVTDLEKYLKTRQLIPVSGSAESAITDSINNVRYTMDDNKMGFKWISLSLGKFEGTFDYETDKGVFSLCFGMGYNQITQFPFYNHQAAVSGAFRDRTTFLIKAQLIDESVGSVLIQLAFVNDSVTLMMRKFEETMYSEFDGFVTGHINR